MEAELFLLVMSLKDTHVNTQIVDLFKGGVRHSDILEIREPLKYHSYRLEGIDAA